MEGHITTRYMVFGLGQMLEEYGIGKTYYIKLELILIP
jgi:hypothetical protein